MIHVVIGVIQNEIGQILVTQRQQHKFQGGRWEFPGGKVEANENHFAALHRELHEEIGIDITEANSWMRLTNSYADGRVIELDVWRVIKFTGDPYGVEGQKVRWVDLSTFPVTEIPDANLPIIQKLLFTL